MASFQFGRGRVHYATHGSGAALLLIHGAGGSGINWPPLLRRLPGRLVSAIDLPGHGKSDAPGLETITEFRRLILAWADALELETFALAGQSLGSAIALDVALTAPARVQALVLLGSGARIEVNPKVLDALREETPEIYTTLTRLSYGRGFDEEQLQKFEQHMRTVPAAVLWGAFAACSTFDVTARLGEIQASTLIIGGANDRMIPVAGSHALHAGIADSRLEILPNTGHMLHIEQPDSVTELIATFLDSLPHS